MDRLNFSDLKANLASTLDKVNDEHKPMMITFTSSRQIRLLHINRDLRLVHKVDDN